MQPDTVYSKAKDPVEAEGVPTMALILYQWNKGNGYKHNAQAFRRQASPKPSHQSGSVSIWLWISLTLGPDGMNRIGL